MELLLNIDTIVLAGVATTLATDWLKSVKAVGLRFNPRLIALVVSVISSVVVSQQEGLNFTTDDLKQFAVNVVAVLLVSAITYNNITKRPHSDENKNGVQK